MTFLYPYAFFALLAIPILILIYILRNKYKEEMESTTYLWELSKKFLKKKNPFHSMEKLISLIVQCCAVLFLAVSLAHPVFTVKGQTESIVFVLDGSASMNMRKENKTKFEIAKDQIEKIVDDSPVGNAYTLIYAGEETEVVCQEIQDVSQFKIFLDSLQCTYSAGDLEEAMLLAQKMISERNLHSCYLATDKIYEENALENIELLDMSTGEANYAVLNAALQDGVEDIVVTGAVISYAADAKLDIGVYLDDEEIGAASLSVTADEEKSFSITLNREEHGLVRNISSLNLKILNEDVLMEDNEYIVYQNDDAVVTDVLIVSDAPFYLTAVFKALRNINVTTVSPSSYTPRTGYDVTIFDSYAPASLPEDGAVWFFGIQSTVPESGFTFQRHYYDKNGVQVMYTENDDSALYNDLTRGLVKKNVLVSTYNRYSLAEDFIPIMSYRNIPFLFAGRNSREQREIVFAFDLHDSELPLLYDFVPLMRNCINYSNPALLSTFSYEVGESVSLSISDNVDQIEIIRPDGLSLPMSAGKEPYIDYQLTMVGTYDIKTTTKDGMDKEFSLYVRYPSSESNPMSAGANYSLVFDENAPKHDGFFDNILPVVIVACVFFGLDWILYAHEQY